MSVQLEAGCANKTFQSQEASAPQKSDLLKRIGKIIAMTLLILGASAIGAGLLSLGIGGMVYTLSYLGSGFSIPTFMLYYPAIITGGGVVTSFIGSFLWQASLPKEKHRL